MYVSNVIYMWFGLSVTYKWNRFFVKENLKHQHVVIYIPNHVSSSANKFSERWLTM